ncbi:MAG: VCBS repeat-containing protein [Bacteroidota bacterium]
MHLYLLLFYLLTVLAACQSDNSLFQLRPASQTGVTFHNKIVENDTLNVIDYTYVYNGGGVGVGDVNNDGLDDLFFAGNQVSSRLYLNQGNFSFRDITESAGVNTDRWSTGVAMVDINHDGWLDIYVCVANKFDSLQSKNYFFINEGSEESGGNVTFVDRAESYGLADMGYSTQAAFFDYDRDNDLDMYLLTNAMESASQNLARSKKTEGEGPSNDRLYRNDSSPVNPSSLETASLTFTNVTHEAGILTEGYGLGIAINDINQDGWPDVYAANDFITNDLMWINNGDGTFTDRAADYLKHQTHNGMGTDIADFNNDGLVDIVVLDMLPEDNFRQKMMFSKPNDDRFELNLRFGYTPQYVRNTLQLNNGFTPEGHPSFSEIGQLAGVANTDWSWSTLFADFDNDGYHDLLITNGYAKDVTDLDYISYRSAITQFGSEESKRERLIELSAMLKEAKIHNYAFKNNGDITFTDVSEDWGMTVPSFSNGTAFVDLDNDGDLDIVMNNINDEAFIYENTLEKTANRNFLRIDLTGPQRNQAAIQAIIRLHYDGQQQYHYHSVYRGYKSTVENTVHFGLGKYASVDSVEVVWPDGQYQLITNVSANQTLTVDYQDAQTAPSLPTYVDSSLLTEISDSVTFEYRHQEESFIDFKYQPLLARRYSQEGPSLTVGDINGDGSDDFYVGGAKGQAGYFFIQQPDGQFIRQSLSGDSLYEDRGALLFDADQDGDEDLYVVSGGNEFYENHPGYRDRFYYNDGYGQFRLDTTAIPLITTSGSCVKAADYDQDGDLDLFIGGQLRPREYPLPASSYLLRNDAGKFVDVTTEVIPGLVELGLVTDALWTDYDQNGQVDLLIVGEWMPITIFRNENGSFKHITSVIGLDTTSGWWNTVLADDFDQDGDPDYIVGNLGLNSKYQASPEQPLRLYTKDYDQDGRIDPILTYYIQGKEYPAAFRGVLTDQMNMMRRRFPKYETYANATFDDLFSPEERKEAYVLQADCLTTSYVENLGNGTFAVRSMPIITQTAPVYGIVSHDINSDGNTDIMMVGNSYATEVHQGRYDAFIGQVLLGDGTGNFTPLTLGESGFYVGSDAKDIAQLTGPNGPLWVVASNNDRLKVFQRTETEPDRKYELSASNTLSVRSSSVKR